MNTARLLPSALSSTGGRHRAPRTPGRARRAALATVAAGLPLVPAAVLAAPAHAETNWDKLAQCESGGDWSINTGNGFSGGLQFTPSTWKAFGGSGNAKDASREEQIAVAERVKAEQGMNAWPTCSKKTGQTDSSPNSSSSSGSDSDSASGSDSSSASGSDSDSSSASSSGSDDSGSASSASSTPAKKASSSDDAEPAKKTPSKKASTSAPSSSVKQAASSAGGNYTVKAGDTLSTIAASEGVSGGWAALRDANTSVVSDPNMIFPGQSLALS